MRGKFGGVNPRNLRLNFSAALTGLGIFFWRLTQGGTAFALGYYLPALQAFNLCEFVEFASKKLRIEFVRVVRVVRVFRGLIQKATCRISFQRLE